MNKIFLTLILVFSLSNAGEYDKYFAMTLEELLNLEISTTSKYSEKLKDTPANIYVFTAKQIQERGYRSVADILKALPGVDIQNFARYASPNIVTFRGHSDNNKFLLLQDGVRISAADGEVTNITHNVPLYNAKQVEVLMGPASVSYGADAFMGVINIITMDENDDDLLQTRISMGEDNYGYGYINLHQGLQNGLHLSMGFHAYKSQEYQFKKDFPEFYPPNSTSPTGNGFEFPHDKSKSFFLKLKTKEHWDFGINYSDTSSSTYSSSLPSASAFDTSSEELLQTITMHARYKTDITKDLKSTSLLTLMHYEMDNDTSYNNIFTDFEPIYKYAQSQRISLNQDFVYKLDEKHTISAGIVYNHIDSIPVGADLPTPYDESKDPQDQNMFYKGTNLPIVFFENDHRNYGIYLQDNWKINDEFRLVTGLRYDYDYFYGDTTNPRLSLIYKPNEKNILKLLYGHSFLAPSSDLAFRNFGGFSNFNSSSGLWESFFFRAPNPDLEPEDLRSLELNYEYFINNETHMKISPFYSVIDKVITVNADPTPIQFIPGADIAFTQSNKNSSKMKLYGLDIGLENISEFDKLYIRSWGYFSYIDGKLDENGIKSELPLVSKYKFKGGASLTYNKKYTLTPQLYWIGKTSNFEVDSNDPTKRVYAPSYFLIDLHAEAKLSEDLSIISDIYNLFDNKYTNAIYQSANLAFNEAPQVGRLVTFALHYKF